MTKAALLVVSVILVSTGTSACSRQNTMDFTKRSIIVDLPPGWHQEPGDSTKVYRADNPGSGYLHVSLQPPLPRHIKTGEQVESELRELVESLGMNIGERLASSHEEGAAGIVVFAIYKSPEKGLVQFWLIPSEITIFASYNMGSLDTVKKEVSEAHSIIKNIKWEK